MGMAAEQEARIWQTIGIIAWGVGAITLGFVAKENGVIRIQDTAMLSAGLAASFMMLAGIAGTVFGRAMYAVHQGYNAGEARLWHTFAMVCCGCGAVAVIYAAYASWEKAHSLTNITVGLAGSFLIMAGIICLLGNRVMHHASQKHGSISSGETAKAAGA